MTGVQTCALPICFPVTIIGGAGNFGVADLRTIASVMSRRYASNLFLTWLTNELYSDLNQEISSGSSAYELGNANLVNATTQAIADVFFGGNMEQTQTLFSTFSWQALNIDGYNFALKNARFMQDPATTAANVSSGLRIVTGKQIGRAHV